MPVIHLHRSRIIQSILISFQCTVPKTPPHSPTLYPRTLICWKCYRTPPQNHYNASKNFEFQWHICVEYYAPSMLRYLTVSGGVNLIIVSWVGLARIPLSFNFRQISKAETGKSLLLLSSTALNRPLPRISFMYFGYCCWILSSWRLSSCPSWADLDQTTLGHNLSSSGG